MVRGPASQPASTLAPMMRSWHGSGVAVSVGFRATAARHAAGLACARVGPCAGAVGEATGPGRAREDTPQGAGTAHTRRGRG